MKIIDIYAKKLWDKVYLELQNKPWEHRDCIERAKQAIGDFVIMNHKNGRVLDFGCGTGVFTNYFVEKGYKVTGVDISDIAIKKCKKLYPNSFFSHLEKFEDLHYEKKFDIVFCWSVFHHIPPGDREKYIELFQRITKKKGLLIIGGWDESHKDFQNAEKKRHSQFADTDTWSINDVERLVTSSYEISKSETYTITEAYSNIERIYRYIIATKKHLY